MTQLFLLAPPRSFYVVIYSTELLVYSVRAIICRRGLLSVGKRANTLSPDSKVLFLECSSNRNFICFELIWDWIEQLHRLLTIWCWSQKHVEARSKNYPHLKEISPLEVFKRHAPYDQIQSQMGWNQEILAQIPSLQTVNLKNFHESLNCGILSWYS